ncbi:MAG: hypothetical protein JST26_05800 [Bacteroidetes bacterium]|nr:hypothetical protein [Bacteroidota bacterium]
MKIKLGPVNKKKELAFALFPYNQYWDAWIASDACFLEKDEITLIEIYQKTGSYAICAEELGISFVRAANDLLDIISRLKLLQGDYLTWQDHFLQEKKGVVLYLSDRERFLFAPIVTLSLSHELKVFLKCLGIGTISELIKSYSFQELRSDKSLTEQTANELFKLLHKHRVTSSTQELEQVKLDST